MTVKESNLFSFAIRTKVIPQDNWNDKLFQSKLWRDVKSEDKTFWKGKSGECGCPEVTAECMNVVETGCAISPHAKWNYRRPVENYSSIRNNYQGKQ